MESKQDVLKKVFGYDSFRPGQAEIVDAALAEHGLSTKAVAGWW